VLGGFVGAAHNVAQALMGNEPEELDITFQRTKSAEYGAAMDAYAQLRARRI
jgi:hypothetical protein